MGSCSSGKKQVNTKKTTTTKSKSSSNNGGSSKTLADERIEKPSASLSAACKKLGVSENGVGNSTLYIVSASWIGVKYKYGGNTKSGTDCSGMTGQIYKTVYNKSLSRSSADILTNNCTKIDKKKLREGDLVFFRTDGKKAKTPNHVGIYLKDNKFIHASTSKGVIVSSMTQDYYVQNYIASGRVK